MARAGAMKIDLCVAGASAMKIDLCVAGANAMKIDLCVAGANAMKIDLKKFIRQRSWYDYDRPLYISLGESRCDMSRLTTLSKMASLSYLSIIQTELCDVPRPEGFFHT